jgi:hypothetical protein
VHEYLLKYIHYQKKFNILIQYYKKKKNRISYNLKTCTYELVKIIKLLYEKEIRKEQKRTKI